MIARFWSIALFAGIAWAVAPRCAPAAPDDTPETMTFRRVFVPADRVGDWPRGDAKCLPVEAAEFEAMAAAARPRLAGESPAPAAAVTAARYEARLVGERLVGRVAIFVALSGSPPALLHFEPCNLALGKTAGLGLAPDGTLAAVVERSGMWEIEWSLAGRHDSADVLGFAFELPRSPANRLLLDLPEGLTPNVDRGIVVGSEPADEGNRRWRIELGGDYRFRLRVLPAGVAAHRPQVALLRESRTYDLAASGVELVAQWKLQAHNEPLQQIVAVLDPGLRLVAARYGDVPLTWSAGSASDDEATRVVLTLPEPVRDTERVLRIDAVGKPVIGKSWRLPRIRADGLFWQEGTLTLRMIEPLRANQITPVGCVQTTAGLLLEARSGESHRFQSFDPGATVEVLLTRREAAARSLPKSDTSEPASNAARAAENPKTVYSATIQIDAALGPTSLREICLVRCTPESGAVDRVLVRLFPSRDGSPRWTLSGEEVHQVLARKWSDREQAAVGRDTEGETWELTLRRPRTDPFEITAVRDVPIVAEKTLQVGLASLPEASGQRGAVAVRNLGPWALSIDAPRLAPILPEPVAPEHPPTIRAAFRYDPVRDVAAASRTCVRVLANRDSNAAVAWAWCCRVESWHQADGEARHEAAFDLQNLGRPRLRLTMPAGVAAGDVRGAWIDGRRVAARVGEEGDACRVTLDLPTDWQFPRVVVQWTTSGQSLGIAGALAESLPEADLPVLSRHWTAWLPPGYDCPGAAEPTISAHLPGWTGARIEMSATGGASLQFVRTASIRMAGAIAFLLVASLACWIGRNRPALLIVFAGIFGAAAIAATGLVAAVALGGALGAVFALLWQFTRYRRPPVAAASEPAHAQAAIEPDSTVWRATLLPLIVVSTWIGLLVCDGAWAQDTPNPATDYRVLVPVDAAKKPVGGKVYVPEPLYQALGRQAVVAAHRPRGWLVVEAAYRGALVPDSETGRLGVDVLRAEYELRVFDRATRVRIPLDAEAVNPIPGEVWLDGRAIPAEWAPGGGLSFDVDEPGRYRLEVTLRPPIHGENGLSGLDIAIPRIAAARLELALPDRPPTVDVPSACGVARVERSPPRLVADLGPAERLIVRWPDDSPSGVSASMVQVEQFSWLRVQPGSVVVAVRFKFHAVKEPIHQFQAAVDPRLRLLPIAGDEPPSVETGVESGQARLIAFRWSRPKTEPFTLETTFLLTGAVGVGNFRLPRVEPLGVQVSKHWMAASVDPSLEHEERSAEQIESVPVAEFVDAWGRADAKPISAHRLPASETSWSLSTRPLEPRGAADQTLTLGFGEKRVDLLFEAQLSDASGRQFQYRIVAPKGLAIESVSLVEGGVERTRRWWQGPDGEITVFVNGPSSGPRALVLRGHIAIELDRPWGVPDVKLERCELRSSVVRLFRQSSVVLSTEGRDRPAATPTPASEAPPGALGRLVGALALDPSRSLDLRVTVRLAPHDADRDASARPVPAAALAASHSPAGGKSAPALSVLLRDVTVGCLADHGTAGMAVFDLEPGGAAECPLRLPRRCELIQVLVEGMPVVPMARGDGSLRVPLASSRLPQRVEVCFRGRVASDGDVPGRLRFDAPALGDSPSRQTLWTVIAPDAGAWSTPEGSASRPWTPELSRLRVAAAAIESARAAQPDDPVETPRWHASWTRRLSAARAALKRALAGAEDDPEAARAESEAAAIERRNAELAQRLETAKVLARAAGAASDGSSERVRQRLCATEPALRCAFEGGMDSLQVDVPLPAHSMKTMRMTAAASLALASLGVAAFLHRRRRSSTP